MAGDCFIFGARDCGFNLGDGNYSNVDSQLNQFFITLDNVTLNILSFI